MSLQIDIAKLDPPVRGYDVRGRPYGALIPLERVGCDRHGSSLWRCLCAPARGGCGRIVEATYRALDTYKRHCGCKSERTAPGTVVLEYEGRAQSAIAWARELRARGLRINRKAIVCRLRDGWSVEEALTTPIGSRAR